MIIRIFPNDENMQKLKIKIKSGKIWASLILAEYKSASVRPPTNEVYSKRNKNKRAKLERLH